MGRGHPGRRNGLQGVRKAACPAPRGPRPRACGVSPAEGRGKVPRGRRTGGKPSPANHEVPATYSVFTQLGRVSIPSGASVFRCSRGPPRSAGGHVGVRSPSSGLRAHGALIVAAMVRAGLGAAGTKQPTAVAVFGLPPSWPHGQQGPCVSHTVSRLTRFVISAVETYRPRVFDVSGQVSGPRKRRRANNPGRTDHGRGYSNMTQGPLESNARAGCEFFTGREPAKMASLRISRESKRRWGPVCPRGARDGGEFAS